MGLENLHAAVTEVALAKLLLAQQRNTEAVKLLETAIPVLERTQKPDNPDVAIALVNLAEAYRIEGRYVKAEPLYHRALDMIEQRPALRTAEIRLCLSHFPQMLRQMKRKAEAHRLDTRIKSILPK